MPIVVKTRGVAEPRTLRERSPITRIEAAAYCVERGHPVTVGSLRNLASRGGGPAYRRWGRRALYLPDDLDMWLRDRPAC